MHHYTDLTLDELVPIMHSGCTMDEFYAILQLFFDSVVDEDNPVEVFDMLLERAVQLEHDLFRFNKKSFVFNLKKISFGVDVPESVMKKKAKSRRIPTTSNEYKSLFSLLSNGDYEFDEIIGIASGAIQMAAVAAAALNKTEPLIIRYGVHSINYRDKDSEVKCPYDISNRIAGKRILILDDTIHSSATILGVIDFINQYEPAEITLMFFSYQTLLDDYLLWCHEYLEPQIMEFQQKKVPFEDYCYDKLPYPLFRLGMGIRDNNGIYYIKAQREFLAIDANKDESLFWIPQYPEDVVSLSLIPPYEPVIESQSATRITRYLGDGWKCLTPAEYISQYVQMQLTK